MTRPIPFNVESIGWTDLSESQRDFFCFEDDYLPLPSAHAQQIQRLKRADASRVWQWLSPSLPSDWPESRPHFSTEVSLRLDDQNWNSEAGRQTVRQWLHDRGVAYSAQVLLIYEVDRIVQMPWKLVVKYWDALAWSVGHDMIAMDSTRQWACCFHHEDVIVFGSFTERRSDDPSAQDAPHQ